MKLQDALADELGSDLVETSAHSGARPSHAEWQGKVFSRSGTHPKYPDFKKSTGYGTGAGLGGWNCRHSFFPYFEGMKQVYTQAELDEMNAKKYEYNGGKLTEYEATQKQRQIERNIRKWKREYIGMEAAGQPTEEASAKLAKWRNVQKDFIEQTGLKRRYGRENVEGFGRNEAARARGQEVIARNQREKVAKIQKEEYNKAASKFKEDIATGNQSLKIIESKQLGHIKESAQYVEGKSYIYGSIEDAQKLVDKYAGTGVFEVNGKGEFTKKEIVKTDDTIGIVLDMDGKEFETSILKIHYRKTGTHIVPRKEG